MEELNIKCLEVSMKLTRKEKIMAEDIDIAPLMQHFRENLVGALRIPVTYSWFISGNVATGIEKDLTYRLKKAVTAKDVELHVKTAPTGAALIVDINENATSLFSTLPRIAIDETTEDNNHIFSDTFLAAGAELTMDIDQVGSTVTGADLTVLLHCTESIYEV